MLKYRKFMNLENIRNFCIIAHIDHGKSTLADRMMEITGTVQKRYEISTFGFNGIEREKGITIKLAPVTMNWKDIELNLIDTPGHVDFSYEVSRSSSLRRCDFSGRCRKEFKHKRSQMFTLQWQLIPKIIPVLNKIDLPAADIPRVSKEVINLLGCEENEILHISAKTGMGVEDVLNAVIERIPGSKGG